MSQAKTEIPKAQFGMLGLGVMGQNLALNIERNGYPIAVWNREPEWVDEFIQTKAQGKQIMGTQSLKDFVHSLERPPKNYDDDQGRGSGRLDHRFIEASLGEGGHHH